MLITWFFWDEPIRHDLHLKTALIMSKPQGMCVLKLVNKYRSEEGGKEGVSIQKKGKIKCLRRLETCSHQLHFEQQFWFLLLPADLFLLPLCCRNTSYSSSLVLRPFFSTLKNTKTPHTKNSTQIPISPCFGASLPPPQSVPTAL